MDQEYHDALEEIRDKLERLDVAIRGNGNTTGILVRLDRLERAEALRTKLLWFITCSTVTLACSSIWKMIIA